MTSKSCFLQHKSPFENAELAGTGSSILSFQWLNFAWESFFFFFPQMRITFQLQQSLLGGGNGNSKDNLSPKPLSLLSFPLAVSKDSQPLHRVVSKGFVTRSDCQQSHGDVTSSLGAHAECDGGPTHVRATSRSKSLKWCRELGRGGFNFPLPMESNCSPGEYKWNSCHPTTNCFRTALHPFTQSTKNHEKR